MNIRSDVVDALRVDHFHQIPLEPLRSRLIRSDGCRTDDGGVSGAPAQIASKRVVVPDVSVRMRRDHGHHETGRAESALAAMVVDHRLLHGMQAAVGRRHSFNGPDGLPVDLRYEKDAGVHGAGLRPAILQAGHNNRAGAAVSFVAALLRSGEHSGFPQPVEQSESRIRIGYVDLLVVESELYTRHVASSRSLARFDRESMRDND